MSDTNLIRRTERKGTAAAAASAVLMEAELGYLTDTMQLIGGDGQRAGGYKLTPDNIVAVWPNQADADSPLSLAWWIARADGESIKLRLPAGTYTVAADLTVPANVYLDVDKGAVISIASGKTLTLNCEIGADIQPAITGDGTAVENYIRRLHINENLISHRRELWGEGAVLSVDGTISNNEYMRRRWIHSDYIEIEAETQYTFKAHAPAQAYWCYYNASKEFVSSDGATGPQQHRAGGYTFTTPSGVKYLRLSSVMRDSSNKVMPSSLNHLGWQHLYKLEKGPFATDFTPALRDEQDSVPYNSAERPANNPEAARQLVACAESYIGRGWVYGNDPTGDDTLTNDGPSATSLYDENDVKQIDCQTLIRLAINGIPYFQSKYFNNDYPWRNAKYYSWGKDPDHLNLEGLSVWCYKNGWAISPGINWCNLQAGDLVFWGNNPAKSSYSDYQRYFRNIDHVAMYTGRWVPDPNRDNELHPQSIEIGQTGDIVKHNFIDRVNDNPQYTTGCSVEYIQLIARIPLETPFTEFDSRYATNNVIYSSYYKPSVYAVGNGEKLNIDIYGRNYATWEIGTLTSGEETASTKRIRSGFVPAGSRYKNSEALTEAGFERTANVYYNKDFEYLGTTSSSDDVYARMLFKKSNNSDISSEDLALFKTITAIQALNRDTIEDDVYAEGYHSYAYLSTVIPTGSYLDRHNGKYGYTANGKVWTYLPDADQTKLASLRIADGENNIYIPNGQTVRLMRQAME